MVWGKGPTSFFCMWLSSCPSVICWKDCPFPTKWSWHPCGVSVNHRQMGLFPDSPPFCLFILVPVPHCLDYFLDYLLCNKFLNWAVWVLSLCPSFTRLFWLFWFPWVSIWILGSACQLLQRKGWDSDRDSVEPLDQLWVYCHLNNILSPDPWTWDVFPSI